MIDEVGQLEIHLGPDGSSSAWWTELVEQDCLWPVPVGTDLAWRDPREKWVESKRGSVDPNVALEEARSAREECEAVDVRSTATLEELRRGEISFEQHLEARVQEATQHLEGKVSRRQMAIIREGLRETMQSDPVVAELVRRAMK